MKSLDRINLSRLIYLEGFTNYAKLFVEKRTFPDVHCYTLARYEEQLPGFVRIHKKFLVNPVYIDSISTDRQNGFLLLKDGTILPVARRRYAHVVQQFAKQMPV